MCSLTIECVTLRHSTSFPVSKSNTCTHGSGHACKKPRKKNEKKYTHVHIHSYMHTYMHTCIHAYMHTCIHTCIHACIHAYIHACIHTYIHTFTHHTYAHTHTHTHTHTVRMSLCVYVSQQIGRKKKGHTWSAGPPAMKRFLSGASDADVISCVCAENTNSNFSRHNFPKKFRNRKKLREKS